MLHTNDAVQSAFQLLSTTVHDFHRQNRPCLGAKLKPELYRRSYYNFNEQQLGFPRFGDFLKAAAAYGYVELRQTPGGDLEVMPPGKGFSPISPTVGYKQIQVPSAAEPLRAPLTPPYSEGTVRLRQDLWNAFNSFAGDWVYNSATDVAFRLRAGNNVSGTQPSGLIPIPAGRTRV